MNSLLVKGFQASKCKTQLRLGTSRIKLLRNKKGIQIASDRREVAEFLRNKQENNARLWAERVMMEQNIIEAYDLLYFYAERIAAQLSVIESQKTCPLDLKEDISTLLYASSKCADLPDFAQIRPMFVAKYGKDFVSAATELRPGCGVNGKVIEKLSLDGTTGEAKLKLMKDIAAEHKVDWDSVPFEREINMELADVLKPTSGTHVSSTKVLTELTSGRCANDDIEGKESRRMCTDESSENIFRNRAGFSLADVDEPLPPDLKEYNRRDSHGAGIDNFESGCHEKVFRGRGAQSGCDARSSSTVAGKEDSSRGRPHYIDQHLEEDNYRRAANRDVLGRERPQDDAQHAEDSLGREGSGKGRPQPRDQYPVEDNRRRASSGTGFRGKTYISQDDDEVSRGLNGVGSNEDKPQFGEYWKHEWSDEDADHVHYWCEESRQRDSISNTPLRANEDNPVPEWEEEYSRISVTTRAPTNLQYHECPTSGRESRRDSINRGNIAEDLWRKSMNLAVSNETPSHSSEKAVLCTPHDGPCEDKYDSRRDIGRKLELSVDHSRASEIRTSHRSSDSGQEGPRNGTKTLSSVDEGKSDQASDDQASFRGKRCGMEDLLKISGRPDFDDYDHSPNSCRTTNDSRHTVKRMSLPGGSVHEKYERNRPYEDHDNTVGRRASVGPEDIRRAREAKNYSRGHNGGSGKQVDIRRQSAPISKVSQVDSIEGREASKESKTVRHRRPDGPAVYEDDKPPHFTSQENDEYFSTSRREKFDRQRKLEYIPARYDDDRPRFIKVRSQMNLDDEESRDSPGFEGVKFQTCTNSSHVSGQPTPQPRSKLSIAMTDPELGKTSASEYVQSQSVPTVRSGVFPASSASTSRLQKLPLDETPSTKRADQPPSKPSFMKPPDLDSLIQMFGKKK